MTHITEESLRKILDDKLDPMKKDLSDIKKSVYGDPGDDTAVGLRVKVDRLNTWAKAASVAIGASFTGGLAYLGFK